MVLPVPHCFGSEVPFSGAEGRYSPEVHNCVQVYSSRIGCQVVQLNVQPDHVHLLVNVPPKISISQLMGVVKAKGRVEVVYTLSVFEVEALLG